MADRAVATACHVELDVLDELLDVRRGVRALVRRMWQGCHENVSEGDSDTVPWHPRARQGFMGMDGSWATGRRARCVQAIAVMSPSSK